MTNAQTIDEFYTVKHTQDPCWSTAFPNVDEARRWAKICEFLSEIPRPQVQGPKHGLRILDVGCGRGWMTRLASVYGSCDGVDPVASAIELARRNYPDLTFYVGTASAVLSQPDFRPYDVVVTSEVIEHVVEKDSFVSDLCACLSPGGDIILTTPRGELFSKYLQLGPDLQPVEVWVSERQLLGLFRRHGFVAVKHDRAYIDLPGMSPLHSFCARRSGRLDALGLAWARKALQHAASIYQVWWFRKGH